MWHVNFASNPQGGSTSTSRRHLEEDRVRARINSNTYPCRYETKVAAQEFCKLCKPKINKLKGGYSATASLIFQLWLKDINIHVEDQNLTEREAIQLVKDFTAERACDEVEFYMGMITDDQQTFDGLVNHLKNWCRFLILLVESWRIAVISGTVHWFLLKTSFHPLLWTSSGLTGSWKLSAYIRFGSLRSVKSVKTRGKWKPKKCWKC